MTRGRIAALAVLAVVLLAAALLLRGRPDERAAEPQQPPVASDSSLLVLTWAPSLCGVESRASGCRTGRVERLGQSFLLHGLWPQPRSLQYCDVPRTGRKAPPALPSDLDGKLKDMMSDSHVMAAHEWYAHGSCSGVDPAEYFGIATELAGQVIAILDPLFDRSSGGRLAAQTVRDTVDAKLGAGTGSRVALACRDSRGEGPVVYEVRLSLPPVVQLRPPTPSLAAALAAGPGVSPGCGKARLP